jgi:hypothetical protein
MNRRGSGGSNQSGCQWSDLEERRYWFFVVLHLEAFTKPKKRNEPIFVNMEKFMGHRTASQCKSHHQKKPKNRD